MSAIPSIILSAALACGAAPADAREIINTMENSAAGRANIQSDIESIIDTLEKLGVNTDRCGIKDFICGYFNGCGNPGVPNEPNVPDEPDEPDIPDIPAATKTPRPTKTPDIPTVTQAPRPTKAPDKPDIPAVTQAPSGGATSSYAVQVVDLVNQERAKQGLAALTIDSTLMNAAQTRAVETVRSFSHTRPNGSSFSSVLSEYGYNYRTAGENIAYGQRTPQEVVNAWMNSSGHRKNILNANYTKIGVGCYKSGSTYYWSQLFAG